MFVTSDRACPPGTADAVLRQLRQAWDTLHRAERIIAGSAAIPSEAARQEAVAQVAAARQLIHGVGELLRGLARA
jgi:hypothetical protein